MNGLGTLSNKCFFTYYSKHTFLKNSINLPNNGILITNVAVYEPDLQHAPILQ